MQIVEKSRREHYSAWYGKNVERVVTYVSDSTGEHFLHHHFEGDIPQYDKDRYARDLAAKVERYKETGGEWIEAEPFGPENQFTPRHKNGPVEYIKEVRKCRQRFDDRITTLSYCENGQCWMFHGNIREVSDAFYFIIYTKELVGQVRDMVPEVKYIEDDKIIF